MSLADSVSMWSEYLRFNELNPLPPSMLYVIRYFTRGLQTLHINRKSRLRHRESPDMEQKKIYLSPLTYEMQ